MSTTLGVAVVCSPTGTSTPSGFLASLATPRTFPRHVDLLAAIRGDERPQQFAHIAAREDCSNPRFPPRVPVNVAKQVCEVVARWLGSHSAIITIVEIFSM